MSCNKMQLAETGLYAQLYAHASPAWATRQIDPAGL